MAGEINALTRTKANETMNRIKAAAGKDVFFQISLLVAVATSFIDGPDWGSIDFKVIFCLFELMVVVKAFEEYSLLQHIAVTLLMGCKNERVLTQTLCLVSFLFAMLLTNDVALLTIIPIMIAIARKSNYRLVLPVVLVTVAANLGSSATPMGNPQNLFLFSFYRMSTKAFFASSFPLGAISLILLISLSFLIKPKEIRFVMQTVQVVEKKKIALYMLLSVLAVLSVFGVVPYYLTFPVVLLATLFLNRGLLRKVDYRLLLTFVCIFIAIGNLSSIAVLKNHLTSLVHTPARTYLSSLVLSQFISNVPSTVMLAPFTANRHALFLGANIGGLGTLVASLANLIAFKLFAHEFPQEKRDFLKKFSIVNFGCLAIVGVVFWILVTRFG